MNDSRWRTVWFTLKSSFWLIPMLMVLAAIGLAAGLVQLDEYLSFQDIRFLEWVFSGGPESTLSIMSAVAGSMITVTGVTFSITIVCLSLATSQFGPRLLTYFKRDRANHFTLGTFTATFTYCLLILRTIHLEETVFIPRLAVGFGILASILSMFVLIYFIHHVASIIKVDYLIYLVEKDLDEAIDRLYPEKLHQEDPEAGKESDENVLPADFLEQSATLHAHDNGYLQQVDSGSLVKTASEHDLIIRVERSAGDFIIQGMPLARIWPSRSVSSEILSKCRNPFVFGRQRTPVQDIMFSINQLVEIALRALSPGINDTFTALTCIDRLGAALARIARRTFPSGQHTDQEGKLRLIEWKVPFTEALNLSFTLIRQNANYAVMIRLLEIIQTIGSQARRLEDRKALLFQADMIRNSSEQLPEEHDRQNVRDRFQAVLNVLKPIHP